MILVKNKNKIYTLLLNKIDCGPFDGGCVLMARAIQLAYGGEMVILNGTSISCPNEKVIGQHAVVLLPNNVMVDADGPLSIKKFIIRYNQNEYCKITGHHKFNDKKDLLDAPRNEKLSIKISKLIEFKRLHKIL